MALITVSYKVCSYCGRKTCDGAYWKWTRIVQKKDGSRFPKEDVGSGPLLSDEVETDIDKLPKENVFGCSMDHGLTKSQFTGKKVGDSVINVRNNWSTPAIVTTTKISED